MGHERESLRITEVVTTDAHNRVIAVDAETGESDR
jgi:hypothetical protein